MCFQLAYRLRTLDQNTEGWAAERVVSGPATQKGGRMEPKQLVGKKLMKSASLI